MCCQYEESCLRARGGQRLKLEGSNERQPREAILLTCLVSPWCIPVRPRGNHCRMLTGCAQVRACSLAHGGRDVFVSEAVAATSGPASVPVAAEEIVSWASRMGESTPGIHRLAPGMGESTPRMGSEYERCIGFGRPRQAGWACRVEHRRYILFCHYMLSCYDSWTTAASRTARTAGSPARPLLGGIQRSRTAIRAPAPCCRTSTPETSLRVDSSAHWDAGIGGSLPARRAAAQTVPRSAKRRTRFLSTEHDQPDVPLDLETGTVSIHLPPGYVPRERSTAHCSYRTIT